MLNETVRLLAFFSVVASSPNLSTFVVLGCKDTSFHLKTGKAIQKTSLFFASMVPRSVTPQRYYPLNDGSR